MKEPFADTSADYFLFSGKGRERISKRGGGGAYKEISKLTKDVGISQMKLWEVEAHEERSRSSPSSLAIKTLVGFVVDVISGFNYYILWYEETTASRFLHSSNKI